MARMQSKVVQMNGGFGQPPETIASFLQRNLIGQDEALNELLPFLELYQANLSPPGRPAGVFLLLGPTGTGKTHTAEVVAEALHGNPRHLLRVDCGEYQLDHDVAKLVGAPPGYLGHRETQAVLSQQRMEATTSERSPLSVLLFDEIEKAAPSMTRILLGILDKAFLRTGDNHPVSFENSLIFLSSNLGAREMARQLDAGIGFRPCADDSADSLPVADAHRLHEAAMGAVRKRFAPEFLNRVDVCITYQPLGGKTLESILDRQLRIMQNHIDERLGAHTFQLGYTERCRQFLLSNGCSVEYGARELKRSVHRWVLQPLASLVLEGKAPPARRLQVDYCDQRKRTVFRLLR